MEQPSPDPDVALHLGILAGDVDALAAWEAKYRRPMFRRAVANGLPPIEAENAFEDAFQNTMAQADRLTPIGPGLRKMAYRILANRIADHHRRHAGARDVSLEAEVEAGRHLASLMSRGPDEGSEHSAELTQCLERLTMEQRVVIELLFFEDLSTDLIAARLKIKPNSVTVAKGRGLKALKKCLEEGIDE